jgi:hypothetical protein
MPQANSQNDREEEQRIGLLIFPEVFQQGWARVLLKNQRAIVSIKRDRYKNE